MAKRTVYLVIKEPAFNKTKAKAREEAIATNDDYEKEGALVWEDLVLTNNDEDKDYEIDEDSNSLRVWGDLNDGLGFMSVDIPLDFDMVTDIIQMYVKKINKVRTVLEAIKE